MKSLYDVLGVTERATTSEIRAAFRALAMRFHPDHCRDANATERFVEVRQAYEILSSPEKRALHDRLLAVSRAQPSEPSENERSEFSRWSTQARHQAEREARMPYGDFLKAVLRSTGEGVVAIASGAAQGVFEGLQSGLFKLLFVTVVMAPLGLLVFGLIAWNDHKFEQATVELRPHLNDYLAKYPAGALATERPAPGKTVIVDMNDHAFHSSFKNILVSARPSFGATRDEDVDHLLQVSCERKSVGRYSDRTDAWQWFCDYELVDYREKRVVFRDSIRGSPPPAQKRGKHDGSGENPIFELVKTLEREFHEGEVAAGP